MEIKWSGKNPLGRRFVFYDTERSQSILWKTWKTNERGSHDKIGRFEKMIIFILIIKQEFDFKNLRE